MIAILWVKVLIFQGAKRIFNVGSLSILVFLFADFMVLYRFMLCDM